jgi:hypothetical protein
LQALGFALGRVLGLAQGRVLGRASDRVLSRARASASFPMHAGELVRDPKRDVRGGASSGILGT